MSDRRGRVVLKSLYIASTQGSGGKTTIAVGLCLALRQRGLKAGYFKPVGTLRLARRGGVLLDEDAAFVADLLEPGRRRPPTSARSCSTRTRFTTSSPAPRSTP